MNAKEMLGANGSRVRSWELYCSEKGFEKRQWYRSANYFSLADDRIQGNRVYSQLRGRILWCIFLIEASSNWWKKSSWRHGLWATIRPANYSIFSTYFSTCSPAHMKTQNCMIAWVGGDLKINLVPPPRHVLSRLVRKLNWIMNQTITYHSLSVKKAKYILS